ncbi:hypothetical protein A9239_13575 [Methanosarcina sp. A14]|nr:hypothetical protein A9239_13575 [Methanosarcina sp. A14]
MFTKNSHILIKDLINSFFCIKVTKNPFICVEDTRNLRYFQNIQKRFLFQKETLRIQKKIEV